MSRLIPALLLASLLAAPALAADPDPLRAVLLESKEKNRGVSVYVDGNSIGMVVTAIEGDYVIGRSQTTSRIVIRLDRIDAAAAMF